MDKTLNDSYLLNSLPYVLFVGILCLVLTGCGQSRHEKALQTARTLMGDGSLSDTESIEYLEASDDLLKRLASVKISASQHQVYVLRRLLEKYMNLEMWPRASEVANQLIELQPTEIRWYLEKGRIHSRWSQVDNSHVETGLRAYQTALELDPQSLEAHYGLGILLAFRSDNKDAGRRHLQRVAGHTPVNVKNREIIKEAKFALGRFEFEQGNLSSARKTFSEITEMESITPQARSMAFRNLGQTYREMGDRDRARDALKEAYNLQPRDSQIRQLLRDLGVEVSDRYDRYD